jgi:hypothetical protein
MVKALDPGSHVAPGPRVEGEEGEEGGDDDMDQGETTASTEGADAYYLPSRRCANWMKAWRA